MQAQGYPRWFRWERMFKTPFRHMTVCLLVALGSAQALSPQNQEPQGKPGAASESHGGEQGRRKSPSDQALEQGVAAMRDGKLDVACSYLLHAVQLDPQNPEAHEQLGINYSKRQEWSDAAAEMKRAAELAPRNSQYHYNLGALHFKRRAYPDARAEFHQALDLDPGNADYRFAYASTFEAEEKLPQAQAEFEQLVARFPQKERAQYALASVLYREGNLPAGFDRVEQAIRLDPQDADAYYLRAKIQQSQGKLAEAVQSLLVVTRIEPTHLNAHNLLSELYARLGKPEEARQEREAFAALKAKLDSENFALLGTEDLRSGNYDLAEANFNQAVASDPHNLQALYQLGLTLQQKREYSRAVDVYQQVLASNPRMAMVHAEMGLALASMGNKTEALPHLEQALKLQDDSFGLMLATGRAFLLLQDYARAEACLLRAQQLLPSQPMVLVNLFNVYQQWGKTTEAQRYAKLAADADPQDHRLLAETGAFWLEQRDFLSARNDLERAVALDPHDSDAYLHLAWARFYLGDYPGARLALDHYRQISTASADAHCLSAKLFLQKGDVNDALEEAEQASQLSPHDQQVFLLLAQIYDRLGRKEEAAEARRQYQQASAPPSH